MSEAANLWRPLGEMLVEAGALSRNELDIALEEQERTGKRLGEVLVELQLVAVSTLTKTLLEQCGVDLTTQSGFGSGLRRKLEARSDEQPQVPRAEVTPLLSFLEAEPEAPVADRVAAEPDEIALDAELEGALVRLEARTRAFEEDLEEMRRVLAQLVA